jgi:hypothetical protein
MRTSFKLSTRDVLASSLSTLMSSPLSAGPGAVESESPDVDGAGGCMLRCAGSLEGPPVDAMLVCGCRWDALVGHVERCHYR